MTGDSDEIEYGEAIAREIPDIASIVYSILSASGRYYRWNV